MAWSGHNRAATARREQGRDPESVFPQRPCPTKILERQSVLTEAIAGLNFGASNGSRQDRCRVGPRVGMPTAARPLLSARAFRSRRRGGRRTPPRRRPAPRARGAAALGARHAHGVEHAGRRLSRRRHPALRRHRPKIPRRPPSRSCSNTTIPLCRCRCFRRRKPTTSSPNGNPGAACSGCRCWSPKATAICASLSRDWARCASKPRPWRRRRRTAIARRRPSRLLRRRPGKLPETPVVHRGEREIIARN